MWNLDVVTVVFAVKWLPHSRHFLVTVILELIIVRYGPPMSYNVQFGRNYHGYSPKYNTRKS